jgi:hypothetical protein
MPEFLFEAKDPTLALFTTATDVDPWENAAMAESGETVYLGQKDWQIIAKFLINDLEVIHYDENEKVVDAVTFYNREDVHTFPVGKGVVVHLVDH